MLVTSPGPGEGKSTCAANLAIALAQVGKKVLLVDADMRRPSMHLRFQVPKGAGLSQILARKDEEQAICEAGFGGLAILPVGVLPPNPAELLDSPMLAYCLERWSTKYDHVVVDSPPLLAVTDPVLIARKVTGVLVVARLGTTRDRALHRAMVLLRDAGATTLGTVVNDLPGGGTGEYGYGNTYYEERPDARPYARSR